MKTIWIDRQAERRKSTHERASVLTRASASQLTLHHKPMLKPCTSLLREPHFLLSHLISASLPSHSQPY
eukprot:3324816-Pleurochrysis_carterae.AAC.1